MRRILDQGRIRILFTLGIPPYGYRDASGNVAGFDIAVGRLLAEGLGVAASFQDVLPAEGVSRLQAGEADIMCHVPILIETARQVLITTPTGPVDLSLATRRRFPVRRPSDLEGHVVGVLGGRGTHGVAREVLPPDTSFLVFESLTTLAAAVSAGRVTAVALRRPVMTFFQQQNPELELVHRFAMAGRWLAVGLPFGEHDLLRSLNSLIFLARNQGRLAALSDALLGVPLPELPSF